MCHLNFQRKHEYLETLLEDRKFTCCGLLRFQFHESASNQDIKHVFQTSNSLNVLGCKSSSLLNPTMQSPNSFHSVPGSTTSIPNSTPPLLLASQASKFSSKISSISPTPTLPLPPIHPHQLPRPAPKSAPPTKSATSPHR